VLAQRPLEGLAEDRDLVLATDERRGVEAGHVDPEP
jgi:hypothetical protein